MNHMRMSYLLVVIIHKFQLLIYSNLIENYHYYLVFMMKIDYHSPIRKNIVANLFGIGVSYHFVHLHCVYIASNF